MATSRREPHLDTKSNRTARNMSPVLKPSDSDQGFRRARSVPSSPDRKPSPSPASSSSNPCRPSSSSNARIASSQPMFGSASSSLHGKKLQSSSSMTMRGKADRSGGTSLWPPVTHSPSSKDMNRGAKSPSTLQKSKLSSRPSVENMAVSSSSPKPRTQRGTAGALAGAKTQAVSASPTPGATAKQKIMGAANSAPSIQRTKSVPVRPIEAPRIEEQEVELLMEFDEMESISTPSIEEHLQEWLPDPVELKYVDVIAYVASRDDPSKPSSNRREEKNDVVMELISGEQHDAKENEEENADVDINSEAHVVKEAVAATELKEAADETWLSEVVSETGLNETISETKSKEVVVEPELIVKEKAKAKEEKLMPPKKTVELVQGWRKDDGSSSEVKEEGRSRPMEERKSKVMALIGKFETAMSGRE